MKLLGLFVLVFPFFVHALEVDEKLTVRIMNVSESKKTLMLNRGIEDGLVEGDHAKLIVTAGIVARAVCVKISPTRSVWSVYRLVNADFITNDSVMTLKITPPVKISKDESQSLVQDDVPTKVSGEVAPIGIPLADGAQDLDATDASSTDNDLKALERTQEAASIVEKNLEFYSFLNISGLTSKTKTDIGDKSFSNSQSFQHIGLGSEYYPRNERMWYSTFSLMGELSLIKENSQAYNGAAVTNDLTQFSLGINWHPGSLPSVINHFIPYVHLAYHIGSVKSSYKAGTNTGLEDASANGMSGAFSLGAGFKFYSYRGFGFRGLVDYYSRVEKYKEDDLSNKHNKSVAGPRLMLALSYRI